ncbi:MAG TPA: isoprenyl transferase [Phycisphaeraceae bacterium]
MLQSQVSQQESTAPELELPRQSLPDHIAIIMDGNGRWAVKQGRDRTYGHRCGAEAVRPIVTECARLGLNVLTLYSFSTENWTRSNQEVQFLMRLYVEYLRAERQRLEDNNIRFIQIGRREGLPAEVVDALDEVTQRTAHNTGLTLALALNYGSRTEITDAVRAIAREVRAGRLDPDAITEQTISDRLYTAKLPDPDLLIRTAGEMRLSNYLLWQISYAELYVADVCWPQFDVHQLHEALRAYAKRQRKFGAVLGEPPEQD